MMCLLHMLITSVRLAGEVCQGQTVKLLLCLLFLIIAV